MAMARLAVSLPYNAAEAGDSTFWLGAIAFGKQADMLAKHQKGGPCERRRQYAAQPVDRAGAVQGYQVVTDSVISARTVRPAGRQDSRDRRRTR